MTGLDTGVALASTGDTSLEASTIYRPGCTLHPPDVYFISGDKEMKTGFHLHTIVLALHSPVFQAIIEASRGSQKGGAGMPAVPIELPESARTLKALFQALYAGNPYRLIRPESVISLCVTAHKYNCSSLRGLCLRRAKGLVTKALLSGGPSPSLADLLYLGQQVESREILDAILARGPAAFCKRAPVEGVSASADSYYCQTHKHQPRPCAYGCVAPAAPDLIDSAARDVLNKLSPSTLVELLEAVMCRPPLY